MTRRDVEALNLLAVQFLNQPPTNALQAATSWQKMEVKIDMVTSEDAAARRMQGDKTDIRYFSSVLNAFGGMEKPGMIAAADPFNGNQDRFSLGRWFGMAQTPGHVHFGGRSEGADLLWIQNVGNIVRVMTEKRRLLGWVR